jgi:hypothetical protein
MLDLPDNRYGWHRAATTKDMSAYERATEYLVGQGCAHDFIRGIYSGGSVRYPGLSDLDILYVLEDDFTDVQRLKGLMRCSIPVEHHYVCTHDPFFIRSSELDRLFGFAPFFALESLWQRESSGGTLENTDETDLLFYLAETLIDSYPREMIGFLLLHTLDDRELVARLKGLGYCLDLMKRITGITSEETETWMKRINGLRDDFFNMVPREREKRLLALTREGLLLSRQMVNSFTEWITGRWKIFIDGHMIQDCSRLAGIYRDPSAGGYGTLEFHQREIFLERPAVLGLLLREYAKGEGPFSSRIRKAMVDHFRVTGDIPGDFLQRLSERTRLRNDHQAWKDRMGLGLPGFMTFGYETSRRNLGFRTRLRGMARRGLTRHRESLIRNRLKNIVS